MTKTALYRHYDADGQLLYVGVTATPARRLTCHKNASKWFHDVRTISLEWHDDLDSAREAERRAIRAERPLANVALQENSPKPRVGFPEGLVAEYGTAEAFAEAASKHELAPRRLDGTKRTLDRAAVYMWKQRDRVPYMWQPVVESLQDDVRAAS